MKLLQRFEAKVVLITVLVFPVIAVCWALLMHTYRIDAGLPNGAQTTYGNPIFYTTDPGGLTTFDSISLLLNIAAVFFMSFFIAVILSAIFSEISLQMRKKTDAKRI